MALICCSHISLICTHISVSSTDHAYLRYIEIFFLIFSAPVEIVEGPTDRRVLFGTTVYLKCEAAGIPKPDIMWMKNSQTVSTQTVSNGTQNIVLKCSSAECILL